MVLRKTITLVVKVTHLCNLKCDYCFYLNKNYISSSSESLDINRFKEILLKTSKISENINIVFHGGEPLLMPIEYYNKVLDYQQTLEKDFSVKFLNSIQSNGTILSKQIVTLLK